MVFVIFMLLVAIFFIFVALFAVGQLKEIVDAMAKLVLEQDREIEELKRIIRNL